eukprot:TRINITY_DN34974_c0_g1_i2.p1 TRINITY_DN34974_c0_g1~~TRINITY_DN34974_c0_g1_i2.p1  ORF type:complete len:330 (+),score=89.65 TRINITY_DN34974_c0_g1_i2:43-990(+)
MCRWVSGVDYFYFYLRLGERVDWGHSNNRRSRPFFKFSAVGAGMASAVVHSVDDDYRRVVEALTTAPSLNERAKDMLSQGFPYAIQGGTARHEWQEEVISLVRTALTDAAADATKAVAERATAADALAGEVEAATTSEMEQAAVHTDLVDDVDERREALQAAQEVVKRAKSDYSYAQRVVGADIKEAEVLKDEDKLRKARAELLGEWAIFDCAQEDAQKASAELKEAKAAERESSKALSAVGAEVTRKRKLTLEAEREVSVAEEAAEEAAGATDALERLMKAMSPAEVPPQASGHGGVHVEVHAASPASSSLGAA